MTQKVYKNSTELMQLHGAPVYMDDMVEACLAGRLNLFLQGDTGSGKTQLARDAMTHFGKKGLFILGRNDMDTRELFQQINLGKLGWKPNHNLEPLVNPETGEVEWFYPKLENGVFIYQKLSESQTKVVKAGLERIAGTSEDVKELTNKVNYNMIVVDELPNCVPAVRAQLFNLFDGFIEINGKAHPFGKSLFAYYPDGKVEIIPDKIPISDIQKMRESGIEIRGDSYSVGIATGNIGQQFTESANELGRALKDRMHITIDTDYFFPQPGDTLEILAGNTNPRVEFHELESDPSAVLIERYKRLSEQAVPLEKLIISNYLLHGLDYCSKGSKRQMKGAWPTQLDQNEQSSDVGLVLPVSPRAAKSIIRLSQSLDELVKGKLHEFKKAEKGYNPDKAKAQIEDVIQKNYFSSMMQAYKFVSAYSGVLNQAMVDTTYSGDRYKAIDAIIATTQTQFEQQKDNLAAALEMVQSGKIDKRVLDKFSDRWGFMGNTLEVLKKHYESNNP